MIVFLSLLVPLPKSDFILLELVNLGLHLSLGFFKELAFCVVRVLVGLGLDA